MLRSAFLALFAVAVALPASADAVLEKARAVSKAGPAYVFDVHFNDGVDQFLMTVDQSRPNGQRVVKFSPSVDSLKGASAKKADNLVKRTAGDIWCSSFAENIPADARRIAESASSATYSFTPLPGTQKGDVAKAYKYLKASATIDKVTGAILSYEMAAPKAFKPLPVAKVDKLTLKVACKPAPDGRTYADSFDFDLKGSALMKSLDRSETRRITNLKPAA